MRTPTTTTLRDLIVNEMNVEKHTMTPEEIGLHCQTLPVIQEEMFKILDFFRRSIFNREMVRRQIHQIQTECAGLINALDRYTNLPELMQPLKTAVMKCLDEISQKLDTDFETYLNLDIRMPLIYLRGIQAEIQSDIAMVSAGFKKHGADPKLQAIILESITDVAKAIQVENYRVRYVKSLQYSLISLCNRASNHEINNDLCELLLTLNYNPDAFVKYYRSRITRELSEIYELKEQFNYLYLEEKMLDSHPMRKYKLAFDRSRKKAREILILFVRAELSYLQKRESILHPDPVTMPVVVNPVAYSPRPGSSYKIRFSLSVDALAYLIRLMIQAKVIESGVRTELLSFIAGCVQTPGIGSNGISPTSLGVKYKQVVQSTANQIRAALKRMLHILDTEFPLER
ncbi:hypothetical protein [Pedobacter metabolipauper]|uniref:Uncharacterized protein n=1 Tax=Pedobacter metabolipauper TaxID=425513 RepID=A0A4R6SVR4_9SPHI|nr:hypothetical protein [Pedobacter metabolipauper]TDQ09978.1 hypothetical protein ATK78_2137 [Pedobacter metabolipauper]